MPLASGAWTSAICVVAISSAIPRPALHGAIDRIVFDNLTAPSAVPFTESARPSAVPFIEKCDAERRPSSKSARRRTTSSVSAR